MNQSIHENTSRSLVGRQGASWSGVVFTWVRSKLDQGADLLQAAVAGSSRGLIGIMMVVLMMMKMMVVKTMVRVMIPMVLTMTRTMTVAMMKFTMLTMAITTSLTSIVRSSLVI